MLALSEAPVEGNTARRELTVEELTRTVVQSQRRGALMVEEFTHRVQ